MQKVKDLWRQIVQNINSKTAEKQKEDLSGRLLRKGSRICLGVMVLAAFIFGAFHAGGVMDTWGNNGGSEAYRFTVVIDPGHGGIDPGKVGINGIYEKEINLQIALQLKEILEQNDCRVVMTRTSDEGLYQEGDTNRKMADLRRRCELIEDIRPDVTISVHQNSFSQESSRGAQVFYQSASTEGKRLAGLLQKELISTLDTENHRTEKANNDYYMLKNTSGTIVIVECGFLSNSEESELLCQEPYQRRVAWAIAIGTMQYLQGVQEDEHGDRDM